TPARKGKPRGAKRARGSPTGFARSSWLHPFPGRTFAGPRSGRGDLPRRRLPGLGDPPDDPAGDLLVLLRLRELRHGEVSHECATFVDDGEPSHLVVVHELLRLGEVLIRHAGHDLLRHDLADLGLRGVPTLRRDP